jgi:hypothetical protein
MTSFKVGNQQNYYEMHIHNLLYRISLKNTRGDLKSLQKVAKWPRKNAAPEGGKRRWDQGWVSASVSAGVSDSPRVSASVSASGSTREKYTVSGAPSLPE